MHLVCTGVTKRMLLFLKGGPPRCKMSGTQIGRLSSGLISLRKYIPSEFARQPRGLDEVPRWKATEYRQFLLYTGIVVMKDNTPSNKHYRHYLKLALAMRFMLQEDSFLRESNLDTARQLLREYVSSCKALYSDIFAVYNIHGLLHLPEDVEHFGCSLNRISSFPFENYLKSVKAMVRSAHNPVSQVVTHLSTRQIAKKQSTRKIGFSLKDNCFLLKNGDVAYLTSANNDQTYLAKVVKRAYLKDFFKNPIPSSRAGIFTVENMESVCVLKHIHADLLACKCMSIPRKASFVVMALVHDVLAS